MRFGDVTTEKRPIGGTQVSREVIAGPDASDEDTYERAIEWIHTNGFDMERFRHIETASDSQVLPANDLLGKLIGVLDAEDLEKVSIPMEVVAKLRRHPL